MKTVRLLAWLSFFFVFNFIPASFVPAQSWENYRDHVLDRNEDHLIRRYVPERFRPETKTIPNTSSHPDRTETDFRYRTDHPMQLVDGPFPRTKALRLDAGYFEAAKLKIDRAFTVEMRVRKNGQGRERGNAGSTNGTLFGMGNGWDNGFRLTTDDPGRRLVFSIGRPEEAKSRNLVGSQPLPDGVWFHLAAVWNGKDMRLYVDGLLHATIDFDGVLTEPSWGFRVGYNNAGVGSLKMDVGEVMVYDTALHPIRILGHALLQPNFPGASAERIADLYLEAVEEAARKDIEAAERRIDELFTLNIPDDYRFALRRFKAELYALGGQLPQTQRLYAELLADPNLPEGMSPVLLRRLMTSNVTAPPAPAPSAAYRTLLDDKTILLDDRQRTALEKCLAEARFAEGKTEEARNGLQDLKRKESELLRKSLEEIGLSSDPTDLYKNYRDNPPALEDTRPLSWENRFGFTPNTDTTEDDAPDASCVFVAPDGKADHPGTKEKPFGSLTQARDHLRKQRAEPRPGSYDCVFVRGGTYPVTETFRLEQQDGGTKTRKVVYRAYRDERAVFTGGVSVGGFKPVEDPAILTRLPEQSRNKVRVATIPGAVVFPPVQPRGYGRNGLDAAPSVELFIDDRPQQIARWPNAPRPDAGDKRSASEAAFARTGKVHAGAFDTPEAGKPGIFEYSIPRPERWTEAKDAMLFGYWGHLWAITSCRIERIDTESKRIVLATGNPYGFRENMPYYAFNLLEEIDEPGEWYLDRINRILYVYPPENVDLNTSVVRLSTFPNKYFEMENVSNLALVGLTFEEGTGTAGEVRGGENVWIVGCRFHRFGNWGLGLQGLRHGVLSCDFRSLGGGGIMLSGGDIRTLSPGGCVVENCLVHDFSRVDRAYAPAAHIDGVGNRLAHNLFCDSPGHAIRVEGMQHTLELNEVHSIVYESDDQSGIDIWGNPFIRGMIFRYNYWHHIGSGRDVAGQAGIRLDDMISSVLIYGNVFFRSSGGFFGAVQIHGGKDNVVDSNLMIDCKYAISFSPWGEKRWLDQLDNHFGRRARANGFDPDSDVYRSNYPDYAESRHGVDRNIVTRNAAIGCDGFERNGRRNVFLENVMLPWMPDLFPQTREMKRFSGNRVPADARTIRDRLSIPGDSPIYRLLDIEPLPVDRMGLYLDEFRSELPRPGVTPFFILE